MMGHLRSANMLNVYSDDNIMGKKDMINLKRKNALIFDPLLFQYLSKWLWRSAEHLWMFYQ